MQLKMRLKNYASLMRLDKPIGSFLLLWPTLWALWIANACRPSYQLLVIFILGSFFMRSAGCVMNDIIDCNIDRKVSRTKNRPLASGTISVKEAFILVFFLCFISFLLLIELNKLSFFLAIIALFFVVTYPFTKRFFSLPQVYLGLTFSFGIPIAFAASKNSIPSEAWILFLANFFWIIAYDTEYAMMDKADDMAFGIKTSAITFGDYDVLAVIFCHIVFLLLMIYLGWYLKTAWIYYLAVFVSALLIIWQYFDIRLRLPEKCFNAFRNNNFIGIVLFFGIAMQYFFSGMFVDH